MSEGQFKFVFKPFTGTFELERQGSPVVSGFSGGAITAGTLIFPGGVVFEVNEGVAMTGTGEINLAPGSEIVVLP